MNELGFPHAAGVPSHQPTGPGYGSWLSGKLPGRLHPGSSRSHAAAAPGWDGNATGEAGGTGRAGNTGTAGQPASKLLHGGTGVRRGFHPTRSAIHGVTHPTGLLSIARSRGVLQHPRTVGNLVGVPYGPPTPSRNASSDGLPGTTFGDTLESGLPPHPYQRCFSDGHARRRQWNRHHALPSM